MKVSHFATLLSSSTLVFALPSWSTGIKALTTRKGDDYAKNSLGDSLVTSGRDHPEDGYQRHHDDYLTVTKTRPDVSTGRGDRGRGRGRGRGGRKGKGDCDDDPSAATPTFGLIGNNTIVGNNTLAGNATTINATITSTSTLEATAIATVTLIDDNGADSPLSAIEARALKMLDAVLGH